MVGLMWRHAPAHHLAKEIMQGEEFGRPLLFQARYLAPGPGLRRDWGLTEEQKQHYFILDHVIHIVDCTRFFMGETASVQAFSVPPEFGHDAFKVNLVFESGAVGNLTFALYYEVCW